MNKINVKKDNKQIQNVIEPNLTKEDFEPDWLKKAAKTMLQGRKESYEDEDQNELMNLINNNDEDQL